MPSSQAFTARRLSARGALVALLTAACSSSSDSTNPNPVAMVIVTPDSATLATGDRMSLSATARDSAGANLAGRAITWVSAEPTIATVDVSGHVTAVAPGSVTVTATSEGKTASASILVRSANAMTLAEVSGSAQHATLSAQLAAPLVVKAIDAHGAAISGVVVTWTPDSGSGSVSPATSVTDASGLAQTRWTLGRTFLWHTLTASANGSSVGFTALGEGSGSLAGRLPYPAGSAWNTDISSSPVDSNSDSLIARCGASRSLHPDFVTTYAGAPNGIPYVIVHGSQAKVPVSFDYSDESDPGPYPIPTYAPIEGGSSSSGDRHVLVIDWDHWKLYELFDSHPQNGGASWTAGSGAIWNLTTGAPRPAGWTSADAAGLPIFLGLVRYDEVIEQGLIRHALRFTCPATRKAYVAPASHWASSSTDPNLPPMGMRVRLKSSVDISGFSPHLQVILRALQHYGMFVADNGSGFYLSGAPDPRWSDDELHDLGAVHGSDFEVVKMGTVVEP